MRTLKRTISALVVLLMLLVGSADVLAHGGGKHKNRGRGNQGRHLGWSRGRHVGWDHSRSRHVRDDDFNNRRWRRRAIRRARRGDRREFRRDRRSDNFDSRREMILRQRMARAAFWRNRRF